MSDAKPPVPLDRLPSTASLQKQVQQWVYLVWKPLKKKQNSSYGIMEPVKLLEQAVEGVLFLNGDFWKLACR